MPTMNFPITKEDLLKKRFDNDTPGIYNNIITY